jgi:hypothetical protein
VAELLTGYSKETVLQAVFHAWEFLDHQQAVKNKEFVRRNWKRMQKWTAQAKAEIQDLRKKHDQASERCKELSDRLTSVENDKKDLQQRYEEKCKEKRYLSEKVNRCEHTPNATEPVKPDQHPTKAQRVSPNDTGHSMRSSQEAHAIRASRQHGMQNMHGFLSSPRAGGRATNPATPQRKDAAANHGTPSRANGGSGFQVGRRTNGSPDLQRQCQQPQPYQHSTRCVQGGPGFNNYSGQSGRGKDAEHSSPAVQQHDAGGFASPGMSSPVPTHRAYQSSRR